VTPDGRQIVVGGTNVTGIGVDAWARLWEISTGREVREFIDAIPYEITPDGQYLIARGRIKSDLILLDLATGERLRRYMSLGPGDYLVFGPTETLEVVQGNPNMVVFVRGMNALTIDELLDDAEEVWRQFPPAPALSQYFEASASLQPAEPLPWPPVESNVEQKPVTPVAQMHLFPEQSSSPSRPSPISTFLRRLFK
jgi:hypothetical protein